MKQKIEMTTVYVCGPITGQVTSSLREAVRLHEQLRVHGYIPFVPHFYHLLCLMAGITYKEVIRLDGYWLSVCKVVYHLPGSSSGVTGELKLARRLEIPIVDNMEDLLYRFPVKPIMIDPDKVVSTNMLYKDEGDKTPFDNYHFLCECLGI